MDFQVGLSVLVVLCFIYFHALPHGCVCKKVLTGILWFSHCLFSLNISFCVCCILVPISTYTWRQSYNTPCFIRPTLPLSDSYRFCSWHEKWVHHETFVTLITSYQFWCYMFVVVNNKANQNLIINVCGNFGKSSKVFCLGKGICLSIDTLPVTNAMWYIYANIFDYHLSLYMYINIFICTYTCKWSLVPVTLSWNTFWHIQPPLYILFPF